MKRLTLTAILLTALVTFTIRAERKESVQPLLTTEWGQTSPYNNLCPEYADGKRCKTSCVATAMAQIMRYHKYPTQGKGQKSIKWEYGTRKATLSADFGATTYLWDDMLDNYRGQYTPTQADAVATIMYHLGIASDAEYTPDSGAFIDDAFNAAITHFGYSTGSVLADREYFDDDTWTELVFDAISAGFPVYYGGYTASYSGHAFVLDGYDTEGKAHVNWGFGSGGGYYDMSSLGSYTYGQSAMILYPQSCPSGLQSWMVCSTGISVDDSKVAISDSDAAVTINAEIKNFTAEAPAATFGLRLRDTNGNISYIEGQTLTLPDNRYVSLKSFNVPASAFNVTGTFEASPVYRLTTATGWTPVKMLRKDAVSSFHITVSDTHIQSGMTGIDGTYADRITPVIITNETIMLSPSATTAADIYDTNGRLIARLTPAAPVSPPLPHGIYIVSAGPHSQKVTL